MGLNRRNNSSQSQCARCGTQFHDGYQCNDCFVLACVDCGDQELGAHGPGLCSALQAVEQAAANEEKIAQDSSLDGGSAKPAKPCEANALCPSCGYPRDMSSAESKLHYLEQNGKPRTKAAFNAVNMSGREAHSVMSQSALRTQTRAFLARYDGQSPCSLLQGKAVRPDVEKAFRAHMMDCCMAPVDQPEVIAKRIQDKQRERPLPEEVRKTVDALPPGDPPQPSQPLAPDQTVKAWMAELGDRKNRDLKNFLRRYPQDAETKLTKQTFTPADKSAKPYEGRLLEVCVKGDDGCTVTYLRSFKANGNASYEQAEFIERDPQGEEIERGSLESQAKTADKRWHQNVFKNLMKAGLTQGNQCAYCEELQGDFTLPQRQQYAQSNPEATPPGFVGEHLLQAMQQAGGLQPYMNQYIDRVCDELAHALDVACQNAQQADRQGKSNPSDKNELQ